MDTIYLIDPDHDWLIRSKYSLSFSTRKAFSLKQLLGLPKELKHNVSRAQSVATTSWPQASTD
jgi:hypothetical protein